MREALAFYREGKDFERGAQVALNLAAVFPFTSSLQTQAGRLLIRLKRNSEALHYLERAVDLAPENQDNLLALGRALAISGKPGRARETLEQLLEIAPGHRRAIRLLADLR